MYKIENTIGTAPFKGLNIKKLESNDTCDTFLITLEKGSTFPDHTSPRDALLVVLEGIILFTISSENYTLQKNQSINFSAGEKHKVVAIKNAEFLIIR